MSDTFNTHQGYVSNARRGLVRQYVKAIRTLAVNATANPWPFRRMRFQFVMGLNTRLSLSVDNLELRFSALDFKHRFLPCEGYGPCGSLAGLVLAVFAATGKPAKAEW